MRTIDPEIIYIAQYELLMAFTDAFGGLVTAYLDASEGLADEGEMKAMLQDRTSVYAPLSGDGDEFRPNIWCKLNVLTPWGSARTQGYDTVMQALQDERAVKLYIQGRCILEMADDGEWQVPNEEDK